jgi:hypothetical protein
LANCIVRSKDSPCLSIDVNEPVVSWFWLVQDFKVPNWSNQIVASQKVSFFEQNGIKYKRGSEGHFPLNAVRCFLFTWKKRKKNEWKWLTKKKEKGKYQKRLQGVGSLRSSEHRWCRRILGEWVGSFHAWKGLENRR